MSPLVVEQTVNLPVAEAYADLKAHFKKEGCKIVSESAPSGLVVKHGSLWGITPRNAKKTVTCSLTQTDSGTRISCISKLSGDWVYLTVVGSALSVVIVGLCLWISADLNAFLSSAQPSTWSWIAAVGSYTDYDLGASFVNLTQLLAVFLSAIIATEIIIALYARSRIDLFAKGILKAV